MISTKKTRIQESETITNLAESFGKELVNCGFSHKDLVKAATILLDQAIQFQKNEPTLINRKKHYKN